MANFIKMAIVQSILSLHAQGLSARQIARTLRISRGSVARHLRRQRQAASNGAIAPRPLRGARPARVGAASNGANAPTGWQPAAAPAESSLPATERAAVGPQSKAARWQEFILQKHAQGLSARRIHQDLRDEPGTEEISYDSVRRLLKRQGSSRPLPFRRMECEPGQEAQVNFGTGARILMPDGKRRKTHVLRVVLSHSRKGYSEACFRQTAEEFLRVLENAFWHFGGAPRTVVIDYVPRHIIDHQPLRRAAEMLKRVLQRGDEVVGGLPPHDLAVTLARMAQDDAEHPRPSPLALLVDDRRPAVEIDLGLLAWFRLQPPHGQRQLGPQSGCEPPHAVIAAGEFVVGPQILEDALG